MKKFLSVLLFLILFLAVGCAGFLWMISPKSPKNGMIWLRDQTFQLTQAYTSQKGLVNLYKDEANPQSIISVFLIVHPKDKSLTDIWQSMSQLKDDWGKENVQLLRGENQKPPFVRSAVLTKERHLYVYTRYTKVDDNHLQVVIGKWPILPEITFQQVNKRYAYQLDKVLKNLPMYEALPE